MNNNYNTYQSPYYINTLNNNPNHVFNGYRTNPYWANTTLYYSNNWRQYIELKDYGTKPFVVNIEEATKQNDNFRTALWTGNHLQLTLMNINPGEDIGLENHPNLDQFIRIEEGQGLVLMGDRKDRLTFQQSVFDDYAFIIPAGKWHNLINTGNQPLKLYSIYAPVQHPFGTIHKTKAEALAAED